MRIGFFNQNPMIHFSAVNQKIQHGTETTALTQIGMTARNDLLTISGQGKRVSLVQQLMSQKEFIQENKNAMLKDGLENGYIDENKIKEYDEQLKMLEEKIAQAMTEEVSAEKESVSSEKKVLTEEEYQQKQMTDLMKAASGIRESEVILSVKDKMNGEASVLKAEAAVDGSKTIQSKLKRIAEIEANVSELESQAGEKLSNVADTVSTTTERITERPEKKEDPSEAL